MMPGTARPGRRFGATRPGRLASTPVRLDLSRSRPAVGWVVAGVVAVASVVAMVWLDVLYPPLPVMIPTTDMYEVHVDFDTFWHSAVALWQGNDIYTTPAKLTNLNPPLLTVLLAPFAWLDALTAYRVWVGLCVLMVLGSLLVVARELRLRPVPVGVRDGGGARVVAAARHARAGPDLPGAAGRAGRGLGGRAAGAPGARGRAVRDHGVAEALARAGAAALRGPAPVGAAAGGRGVGGGRVAGGGGGVRPEQRAGLAAHRVQLAGARHRRQRLAAGPRRAARGAAGPRAWWPG